VLLVLVPLAVSSHLGTASAATRWTTLELRPLPGDTSTAVLDANEAGWSVGRSIGRMGAPGRPVRWDPTGSPTLLPSTSDDQPAVYTKINAHGAVAGTDLFQTVLVKDGVRTEFGSYGTVQGLSNDVDPKLVFLSGDVLDTGTGVVTTLPTVDSGPYVRDIFGYDAGSDTALGLEAPRREDSGFFGSGVTMYATTYDAQGAHRIVTDWPYHTAAGAARGNVTAVQFYLSNDCPDIACSQVPALLLGGRVIPLDYTDAVATVADVTSSGLAIGYRAVTTQDPAEPVLFVYGYVVPLTDLVPLPAGVSWISAAHITDAAAIYATAQSGTTLRAFIIRPA
jgi:hypothetical protein